MKRINTILLTGLALAATTFSIQLSAEPPVLQASGPIIYLADVLGEEERLGWCIDTIGRGYSEVLHSRACSADDGNTEGRDFSFTFDAASGRIASETFEGKCFATNTKGNESTIGLYDCESEDLAQKFVYSAEQMTLHPSGRKNICVSASASSVDHGMFQSRALALEVCEEIDTTLRQWVIKPKLK